VGAAESESESAAAAAEEEEEEEEEVEVVVVEEEVEEEVVVVVVMEAMFLVKETLGGLDGAAAPPHSDSMATAERLPAYPKGCPATAPSPHGVSARRTGRSPGRAFPLSPPGKRRPP
jgi:hypothetical protein